MNRKGSNQIIGVVLILVALGSYFFGLGAFGFFPPLIALVVGIVFLFMKNPKRGGQSGKAYKASAPREPMRMHYLFYIVGVIFIFGSVWYFAREYIYELARIVKLILLILSIIVTFTVAEIMRGKEI